MQCIICKNHSYKVIKESVRDDISTNVVMCTLCGHQQLGEMPTENQVQEFYNQDLQAQAVNRDLPLHKIRNKSLTDINRRKEIIKKLTSDDQDKTILDIGTGYGFFIESMEQQNYVIEGIEIGDSRRRIAQSLCKSKIYNCNILLDEEVCTIGKVYDVVTMFQVLEHIADPVRFIEKVLCLTRGSGKIVVEVPNANDHLLTLSDEYSDFFYQKAHVSYFFPDVLLNLLKKCNLKNINIIGVQRYSIENFMNWMILKKPQLANPSRRAAKGLQWLDDYYKERLCRELKSDTLIAIAEK